MDVIPVKTPCIGICTIDEVSGWCRGCRRTREEIENWIAYGEWERIAVLEELKSRQDRDPMDSTSRSSRI